MKLALGTVQFGLQYGVANDSGQVSLEEACRILTAAARHGIDTLDTAIAYGESERVLGRIGMGDWKVVTKLPEMPEGCPDPAQWVDEQIGGSLHRLGVGRLYGILLHRPEQLIGKQGKALYAAVEGLKARGYAEKIGVSVYSPDELERLFEELDFDLVQAPLNILDRRLIDTGWGERLKNRGVEVHVRSAFLQGLLLMPPSRRPEKFGRWQSVWLEWGRWLQEHHLTPLEGCLRYVLSVDKVDKVVIGIDSMQQFSEILTASCVEFVGPIPEWPQLFDKELLNPALWSML